MMLHLRRKFCYIFIIKNLKARYSHKYKVCYIFSLNGYHRAVLVIYEHMAKKEVKGVVARKEPVVQGPQLVKLERLASRVRYLVVTRVLYFPTGTLKSYQ